VTSADFLRASAGGNAVAAHDLTRDEAVRLTQRIRDAAQEVWQLLVESYERQAWAVLGYSSWREYATTEFDIGQSHAYRLLDQARVVTALEEAVGGVSPMGEISERDARRIKPHLAAVTDELQERTAGLEPEQVKEVLREVIREVKDRQDEELAEKRARFAEHVKENPYPPFVPTVPCAACAGSGRVPKETT